MSEYKEVFKRKEIKYLLNKRQYEELMPLLETFAKVDDYGLSKINNIYFDTPDFRLIRTSLDKPVYKEKLRLRTYGNTADETNSFIEIKKKYDGIVYKRRISGKYRDTYAYLTGRGEKPDDSQVAREIEAFVKTYEGLRPAMVIRYDRIAMAGTGDPDFRVTFDTNITWNALNTDLRESDPGIQILAPEQHLMELKVADCVPFSLSRRMSELGIFPASFSKYGRGYTDMIRLSEKDETTPGKLIFYPGPKELYLRKGVAAYV